MTKKGVAIIGSTGSIGTQALDVINAHPDQLSVEVLAANTNTTMLIEQAKNMNPNVVVVGERGYKEVKEALAALPVKVYAGDDALDQIVAMSTVDVVLASIVGFAGLRSTLAAASAGKTIALANKESLVAGGKLLTELVIEHRAALIPVDSEHSAIFQCLMGEAPGALEKIILTASGGPFRGWKKDKIARSSVKDALNHPNWSMGKKVTIDSATLMNKGLEVIEAHWLFGVKPEDIEVVVHPQSIVHSLVMFRDGSIKAQLGLPDMKLPIQLALGWPERLGNDWKRCRFEPSLHLDFEAVDTATFSCLQLAFDCLKSGGNTPCAMNAANEMAVEAYLKEQIGFFDIPSVIQQTVQKVPFTKDPDYTNLAGTNNEARIIAKNLIEKWKH